MKASRVEASLTWLNSSSNWSTTRSNFWAEDSAARVAEIVAAGSSGTPGSVRASSSIGVAPGRIVRTRQVPRGKFRGSSSFGRSPAVTSDDFPEPDEPDHDQEVMVADRASGGCRISSSRPWKKRASSLRNGTMPGYGHGTASMVGSGASR